jgi:hypothetical protein
MAVLVWMLASSTSVVGFAKKIVKPDMKLSLGKSLYPKPKSSNSLLSNRVLGAADTETKSNVPIRSQKPLLKKS